MARISVIVPVRDVAPYLRDCLFSIVNQTHANLEILVVDDGSVDTSPQIIADFAAADARIVPLSTGGVGPGAARNLALSHATGDLVGFVDGDDVIGRRYFERMALALAANGAEVAVTTAERLQAGVRIPALILNKTQLDILTDQTIHENARLVWDTVVWNKLFDMSFFRKAAGPFPEGRLYEDMIVSYRAHARASRIATVSNAGYRWRIRDEGLSVTQRRSEIQNLKDRATAILELWDFIETEARTARFAYRRKVATWDIPLHVETLNGASREYREAVRATLPPVVRRLPVKMLDRFSAINRTIFDRLADGDIDGAAALTPAKWRPRYAPTAPVTTPHGPPTPVAGQVADPDD